MYGIADYGAFVLAILVFLAIPGPGNLALITATGHGGVRAGMAAACGVVAADQVLMWAAVAGVAALLATMLSLPRLFAHTLAQRAVFQQLQDSLGGALRKTGRTASASRDRRRICPGHVGHHDL